MIEPQRCEAKMSARHCSPEFDPMDALADILRALRIESSIISHGRFAAPWAVSTKGAAGAIFHASIKGDCIVRLEGSRKRVELEEGDVALVSRGEAHLTCSALRVTPTPVTQIGRRDGSGGVALVEHGEGEATTELICGAFVVDHAAAHVLLELLPPLIHIPASAGRADWLKATLSLLAAEVEAQQSGQDEVISRLAEVLVVHLLRQYFLSVPAEQAGWIGALRDQQIGRALAFMHGEPQIPWSAEELATKVGMSRASFFSRFCSLVGEPPARYLTRWRMSTAADLLHRNQQLSLGQVASKVGYRSEEAFGRAFRRQMGLTPREYRQQANN